MPVDPKEKRDAFNLSDFDEEAERARLRPIDSGATPSAEIQQAFIKWADRVRFEGKQRSTFEIRPEKLFHGDSSQNENGSFFHRSYYKHPSGTEFSGDDILVDLDLHRTNNNNYYARLRKFGEIPNFSGADSEVLEIQFNPKISKRETGPNFSQTSIIVGLQGRELKLHFRKGKIAALGFTPEKSNGKDNLYSSDPPEHSDFEIGKLLNSGEATFRAGRNFYQAEYDMRAELLKLLGKRMVTLRMWSNYRLKLMN